MIRPRWFFVAVFVLSFPLIVSAQSQPANEVGVFASLPMFEDSSFDDPELDLGVDLGFDENVGYGVSYNRFWSDQLSTEFAAQKMSADMEWSVDGDLPFQFEGGEVDLKVFSGAVQWHFARGSAISPYVGGGVAHVQGEVEIPGFWTGDPLEEPIPPQTADLESETTWLANAGVNFNVMPSLSIGVDAKYIPYDAKGEGDAEDEAIDLNPLVLSAGLKFRF